MMKPCDCCEGLESHTPLETANRPGLDALTYRVGTHPTFLETMKARLSSLAVTVPSLADPAQTKTFYPLEKLTTRDPADPAIALLDAWAIVADVLTFYQERLANEGYLRTANERRSLLELSRLVGYKPRPGVAASVYLAFTIERDYVGQVPQGTRVQSIPGPGELPQSFETSESLSARAAWNILTPRMSRPQDLSNPGDTRHLFLQGTNTNLSPGDPLLFTQSIGNGAETAFLVRWIKEVIIDHEANRTKVTFIELTPPPPPSPALMTALPQEIPPSPDWMTRFREMTETYLNLDQFEVSRGKMAEDVAAILKEMQSQIVPNTSVEALSALLNEVIPQLKSHLTMAEDKQYARLIDWLSQMVAAFETLLSELSSAEAAGPASHESTFSSSSALPTPPGENQPSPGEGDNGENDEQGNNGSTNGNSPTDETVLSKLSTIIAALSKPPNVQPANARRLERNLATLFGPEADTIFKLLPKFEANLTPAKLYSAVENLVVTEPVTVNVYKFRTQARPFGHNAPPRPDHFDQDRQMTIYGEWLFHDPLNLNVPVLKADFIACPTGGPAPLSVQFVNRSEGQISGYEWEIREFHGAPSLANSTDRDFFYTFENPDIYRATLIASGVGGSDSKSLMITVTSPEELHAAFTANPVEGSAPLTVHFTDYSTGEVVSRTWNFGDGTSQETDQTQLTHIFDSAGNYTVTLTVVDDEGTSSSAQAVIIVTGIIIIGGPGLSAAAALPQELITTIPETHDRSVIYLDSDYDVQPGSWVVIDNPNFAGLADKGIAVADVRQQSLIGYGLSGKTTRLELTDDWLANSVSLEPFSTIRGTTVHAESEVLDLAEEPISLIDDASSEQNPISGTRIELDGLYDGLEAGRWLIISGERAEVIDTTTADGETVSGIPASELVMIAGVEQSSSDVPGDTPHTVLVLAAELAYAYKRDTVNIYGNVAEATHGETTEEVLGGGDGSRAFQAFALGKSPLTYLAAPTPAGVESTLVVRVNDVQWHEAESLAGLEPEDRQFISKTDNEGQTKVIFGNGMRGKRLPTGLENVTAVYRYGIGRPGNVAAEQIKLLAQRPLGVKGVINPLAAAGGADPENAHSIWSNAPLALKALDRLVSAQDYADFSRTFAGIDKAVAVRRSNGFQELIYITVAGANDTPIDPTSQLYRNLLQALRRHGDPQQAFEVVARELLLIVISANVQIHPDYLWEKVEPQLRTALLDAFSFQNRELGQDVLLSEVISFIHQIPGVVYVDVDAFGAIPEKADTSGGTRAFSLEEIISKIDDLIAQSDKSMGEMEVRIPVNLDKPGGGLQPAQIACLTPDIPNTLILNQISTD